MAALVIGGCSSESTTVVNSGGSAGGGSGGATAGAGGATGGAAGTGTGGSSSGGAAGTGGGGTGAVAGSGGSAGAPACTTPPDQCADSCLAQIAKLSAANVKSCMSEGKCKCDLGCFVSSYCKSSGGCSPNTKRDVAIVDICAAKPAECSFVFCQ